MSVLAVELPAIAPSGSPEPLVLLRLELSRRRRAGAQFAGAWPIALRVVLAASGDGQEWAGILEATRPAWERAYDREPATRAELAVRRLLSDDGGDKSGTSVSADTEVSAPAPAPLPTVAELADGTLVGAGVLSMDNTSPSPTASRRSARRPRKQHTCVCEWCDQTFAAGRVDARFCSPSCCRRARRARDRPVPIGQVGKRSFDPRPCARCGAIFASRRIDARFCSRSCAHAAQRAAERAARPPKSCQWCGGTFTGRKATAKFCCNDCERDARYQRERARARQPPALVA